MSHQNTNHYSARLTCYTSCVYQKGTIRYNSKQGHVNYVKRVENLIFHQQFCIITKQEYSNDCFVFLPH